MKKLTFEITVKVPEERSAEVIRDLIADALTQEGFDDVEIFRMHKGTGHYNG
jgi:hypothetical protein